MAEKMDALMAEKLVETKGEMTADAMEKKTAGMKGSKKVVA